jgi:hypothetical protein
MKASILNNLRRHYAQAHRASDSRELDVVELSKAEAARLAGDGQAVVQNITIENNIYGDIDNFNEYK